MLFSGKKRYCILLMKWLSRHLTNIFATKKDKINFVANYIPLSQITRENKKDESMTRTEKGNIEITLQ